MNVKIIRGRLMRLDLDAFAYMLTVLGFLWGAGVGLVMFLGKLPETSSLADVGSAALKCFVGMPLYGMFIAAFSAVVLHLPFRWALRALGGLPVQIESGRIAGSA